MNIATKWKAARPVRNEMDLEGLSRIDIDALDPFSVRDPGGGFNTNVLFLKVRGGETMLDFIRVFQENGSRFIRPEHPSMKFKDIVADHDLDLPGLRRRHDRGTGGKKNQGHSHNGLIKSGPYISLKDLHAKTPGSQL